MSYVIQGGARNPDNGSNVILDSHVTFPTNATMITGSSDLENDDFYLGEYEIEICT